MQIFCNIRLPQVVIFPKIAYSSEHMVHFFFLMGQVYRMFELFGKNMPKCYTAGNHSF